MEEELLCTGGLWLPLENTLPPLLRLRSLASGSETFAYRQKTKLSLPPDGFQEATKVHQCIIWVSSFMIGKRCDIMLIVE